MRVCAEGEGLSEIFAHPFAQQLSEMKYKNNNRESVGMAVTSNAEASLRKIEVGLPFLYNLDIDKRYRSHTKCVQFS